MPGHHIRSYLASVTSFPSSSPQRYEIRVSGRLDPRWATWFVGLTLTSTGDGSTVMRGAVADQAALHGILRRVRDAGLPLISITPLDDQLDTPLND
jgi:hypothetical protein